MSQNCSVWETPSPPRWVTRSIIENSELTQEKRFLKHAGSGMGPLIRGHNYVPLNFSFTFSLSVPLIQVADPLPSLSVDWTLELDYLRMSGPLFPLIDDFSSPLTQHSQLWLPLFLLPVQGLQGTAQVRTLGLCSLRKGS